jgi:hypothetical protein
MSLRDSGVMRGVMRGVGNLHGFDGGGGIPTDGDYLLEGFEGLTGRVTDQLGLDFSDFGSTQVQLVALSTSDVTEGLKSLEVQNDTSGSGNGISGFMYDASDFGLIDSYSSVSLDITVQAIPPGVSVVFEWADFNFNVFESTSTTAGTTGPFTLNLPYSGGVFSEGLYINIYTNPGFSVGSSCVVRLDNLRLFL